MKLSDWARGRVSYQTALRWFKEGRLPVKAYKTPSGTILVEEEENKNDKSWHSTYIFILNSLPNTVIHLIEMNPEIKLATINLAKLVYNHKYSLCETEPQTNKLNEEIVISIVERMILPLQTKIEALSVKMGTEGHYYASNLKHKNTISELLDKEIDDSLSATDIEKIEADTNFNVQDLMQAVEVGDLKNTESSGQKIEMMTVNGFEVPKDPDALRNIPLSAQQCEKLQKAIDESKNTDAALQGAAEAVRLEVLARTDEFQNKPVIDNTNGFKRADNELDISIKDTIQELVGFYATKDKNNWNTDAIVLAVKTLTHK